MHELGLLGGDAASAAAAWKALPPVEPLAAMDPTGGPLQPILVGRISNASIPLLVAGTVGKGRVAVFNAAGVYRWGLTASGIAERAGVEAAFFGGMCEWLSAGASERPVRIEAPEITPEGSGWFEIVSDGATQLLPLVRRCPGVLDATIFGEAIHALAAKSTDAPRLQTFLQQQGASNARCRAVPPSLEDVFVTLTRLHRSDRER
jgi:hypothetical protein